MWKICSHMYAIDYLHGSYKNIRLEQARFSCWIFVFRPACFPSKDEKTEYRVIIDDLDFKKEGATIWERESTTNKSRKHRQGPGGFMHFRTNYKYVQVQ